MDTIAKLKDKRQYAEALNLVEKFACGTAFVDHDALCSLLAQGWLTYCDVLTLEGKKLCNISLSECGNTIKLNKHN